MRKRRTKKETGDPGRDTARTALLRINEAEEEARRLITEAREQRSKDILAGANRDAAAFLEEGLAEAKREGDKEREALVAEAHERVKAISEETEKTIEALRVRAKANRAPAVKRAADRISRIFRGVEG